MNKFLSLTLIFLVILLTPASVLAEGVTRTHLVEVQGRELTTQAEVLYNYLNKFNSPLKNNAQDFIDAANLYNLDWRLVAAIAGVESTFGKFTPGNSAYPSYNAWGWGVYGTQAIYFKSWKDGIFTVSEGLRKNYFNKGLTEPYAINKVYAASPTWGSKVTFFLDDLAKFEIYFNGERPENKAPKLGNEIAGSSAKIAFNLPRS